MSKKKRALATVGACGVAGAMLIGGTMAYLTDEEQATNTFTVGKVTVDLEEPNYPGNGSDKVTNIVPNEEIPKDPQTHNTGENDAIVFMAVDIPMSKVVIAGQDGKVPTEGDDKYTKYAPTAAEYVKGESNWIPQNRELFETSADAYDQSAVGTHTFANLGVTSDWGLVEQSVTDGSTVKKEKVTYWKIDRYTDDADGHKKGDAIMDETGKNYKLVAASKEEADFARRVYGYNKVLTADGTASDVSAPIFKSVRLKNIVEGAIDGDKKDINMYTYAIQADNIQNAGAVDSGEGASADSFKKQGHIDDADSVTKRQAIYDIYMNQSGDQIPVDADSQHNLTLGENNGAIDNSGRTSTLNISLETNKTRLKINSGKPEDAQAEGKITLSYTGTGTKPALTQDNVTVTGGDGLTATLNGDKLNIAATKAGTYTITVSASNPDVAANAKNPAKASVTITVQDANANQQ